MHGGSRYEQGVESTKIWFEGSPLRTRGTYVQIRRKLGLDAAWDQVRVEEELELVIGGEPGHLRVRALGSECGHGDGAG